METTKQRFSKIDSSLVEKLVEEGEVLEYKGVVYKNLRMLVKSVFPDTVISLVGVNLFTNIYNKHKNSGLHKVIEKYIEVLQYIHTYSAKNIINNTVYLLSYDGEVVNEEELAQIIEGEFKQKEYAYKKFIEITKGYMLKQRIDSYMIKQYDVNILGEEESFRLLEQRFGNTILELKGYGIDLKISNIKEYILTNYVQSLKHGLMVVSQGVLFGALYSYTRYCFTPTDVMLLDVKKANKMLEVDDIGYHQARQLVALPPQDIVEEIEYGVIEGVFKKEVSLEYAYSFTKEGNNLFTLYNSIDATSLLNYIHIGYINQEELKKVLREIQSVSIGIPYNLSNQYSKNTTVNNNQLKLLKNIELSNNSKESIEAYRKYMLIKTEEKEERKYSNTVKKEKEDTKNKVTKNKVTKTKGSSNKVNKTIEDTLEPLEGCIIYEGEVYNTVMHLCRVHPEFSFGEIYKYKHALGVSLQFAFELYKSQLDKDTKRLQNHENHKMKYEKGRETITYKGKKYTKIKEFFDTYPEFTYREAYALRTSKGMTLQEAVDYLAVLIKARRNSSIKYTCDNNSYIEYDGVVYSRTKEFVSKYPNFTEAGLLNLKYLKGCGLAEAVRFTEINQYRQKPLTIKGKTYDNITKVFKGYRYDIYNYLVGELIKTDKPLAEAIQTIHLKPKHVRKRKRVVENQRKKKNKSRENCIKYNGKKYDTISEFCLSNPEFKRSSFYSIKNQLGVNNQQVLEHMIESKRKAEEMKRRKAELKKNKQIKKRRLTTPITYAGITYTNFNDFLAKVSNVRKSLIYARKRGTKMTYQEVIDELDSEGRLIYAKYKYKGKEYDKITDIAREYDEVIAKEVYLASPHYGVTKQEVLNSYEQGYTLEEYVLANKVLTPLVYKGKQYAHITAISKEHKEVNVLKTIDMINYLQISRQEGITLIEKTVGTKI